MKKVLLGLALVSILAAPSGLVFADDLTTHAPAKVVTTMAGVLKLLNRAMMWLFTIVLILAVFLLIWGAYSFMTAGGNEEALSKAKDKLTYGIVGIAVAIIARSIPWIVASFLGAPLGK